MEHEQGTVITLSLCLMSKGFLVTKIRSVFECQYMPKLASHQIHLFVTFSVTIRNCARLCYKSRKIS
jgi:hypothetical protein